jgi:hypothetical protein
MAMPIVEDEIAGRTSCWCCGGRFPTDELVHLGRHPEVSVCLPCAHFLHQQARAREDARTRSPAARARDGMRAVRGFVMRHGLQDKPVIGRVLRWLDPRVP